MRQGHGSIREWFLASWGTAPQSQAFADQWHAATIADMRVAEFLRGGVQNLAAGLQTDDLLESVLRQLAAAREFRNTGDSAASNHILGVQLPGSSVTPVWLQDKSRAYSTAMHKQGLRTRGRGDGKGSPGRAPKGRGKEGRGRGKGRGEGANT